MRSRFGVAFVNIKAAKIIIPGVAFFANMTPTGSTGKTCFRAANVTVQTLNVAVSTTQILVKGFIAFAAILSGVAFSTNTMSVS